MTLLFARSTNIQVNQQGAQVSNKLKASFKMYNHNILKKLYKTYSITFNAERAQLSGPDLKEQTAKDWLSDLHKYEILSVSNAIQSTQKQHNACSQMPQTQWYLNNLLTHLEPFGIIKDSHPTANKAFYATPRGPYLDLFT